MEAPGPILTKDIRDVAYQDAPLEFAVRASPPADSLDSGKLQDDRPNSVTAAALEQASLEQLQLAVAAGAEALAQAFPVMKALLLVTTAFSTIVFEKLQIGRGEFVAMVTADVDEPTAAIINDRAAD